MPDNPNATAAALSGAIVTVAAYLVSTFTGTDLTSAVTAALTTIVLTIVLWVGRRGSNAGKAG